KLASLEKRSLQLARLAQLMPTSTGHPHGMPYSDFVRKVLDPKGVYRLEQVKPYPSYNEVLADLQNGNLDLAFLDGTVASVYRKTLPIRDSYVFTGFDRFGYAFPKDSPLREDFDRYMKEDLGEQRLQAIIAKWLD